MQAPAGLYHCVNSGQCTWLEFAQEMARLARRGAALRSPVRMADMNCAQRGRGSARCRTPSCDRSASKCRPGRTRSRAISARCLPARNRPQDWASVSATIDATRLPTANDEVSPGDSMPDACTTSGLTRSRRIMKSANDSARRVQLRADAASREPQIVDRHAVDQPTRRFGECLERQPIALVVVLPVLIANGRSEPDLSARRPHQVHAEPMSGAVRQRVDETR